LKRSRWRDPRVWIGGAITAVTLWLALRDVSYRDLARDLARADLPLVVGVSVPCYVLVVWLRALRWRYLTDAVCPIERGALFRATAVGFLANNVFPLRIGEVVRAWHLARETQAGVAPLFGTIVLERVVDGLAVVGMALVIFGVRRGHGGVLAVGIPLLVVGVLPLACVLLLRFAPERAVGLARGLARVLLPDRLGGSVEDLIRRTAEGLGSMQGGRHLVWILVHTLVIWVVLGVLPFLAGFRALGIHLGPPRRELAAAFVTLTAVGIAVALPSAPGFFGPYHLAAREALTRFGVGEELALALGTLSHALMWVTTSALGLAVLRFRATRLDELAEAASAPGKGPAADGR
jgi:glycosyltransferase 2 family protein